MNDPLCIKLRRVTKGWYEGELPNGDRIQLIDAQQHHGHPHPLWLVAINGECDEAYATKREALASLQ